MLNIVTLFSGYDSQCLALNRLGLPYELAAWCEIDKHAITAHNALFPQWKERNLGDVSKVNWVEWHKQHPQQIDLLTYSSPCQDFSSAGLQRGGEEGSGTRSGLLWETEKAVQELRPRYLVFENVGGLVSDKFIDLFNRWQARLNGYGYTNFSQLMNAKDYGVPQNRLRIFMVSVLDCQRAYYFPKPFRLERRLKDVLEQNVEERYYLKDEQVQKLMASTQLAEPQDSVILGWTRSNTIKGDPTYHPVKVANCVTAAKHDNTQNYIVEPIIASMKSRDKDNPTGVRTANNGNFAQRLEPSADQSTSNTITSVSKDNLLIEPAIYGLPHGHYKGDLYTDYAPTVKSSAYAANNPLIEPCISSIRGRADGEWYGSEHQQRLEIGSSDASNTITSVAKDNMVIEPAIIEDFYGTVREPRVYTGEAPTLRADRTGLMTIENADGGNDMVIGSMQKHAYVGSVDDVAPCVNAACGMGGGQRPMVTEHNIRIRRLTERELYRLMDLEEKDIDTLLAAPIPRTQHAKLAGNSIAIACLYYIFRNLFVDTEPAAGTQTTLF